MKASNEELLGRFLYNIDTDRLVGGRFVHSFLYAINIGLGINGHIVADREQG